MAFMLEMIEEVQDQLWWNVGQLHCRGRLGVSRLDKAEEQHERVPIRRHRARAQGPLLSEVFGKERLHECREGGNGYGSRDATHRALLALRRSVRTYCRRAPSAPVQRLSTSRCWRSWRDRGRWTATASSDRCRCLVYARVLRGARRRRASNRGCAVRRERRG